jgi:hypothetical protein
VFGTVHFIIRKKHLCKKKHQITGSSQRPLGWIYLPSGCNIIPIIFFYKWKEMKIRKMKEVRNEKGKEKYKKRKERVIF